MNRVGDAYLFFWTGDLKNQRFIMDSSSYTTYIVPVQRGTGRPDEYDEEVKLIKDITKPDKCSIRNVDKVVSDLMTPTMFLRKGRQQKEKIPFHAVSEESLNRWVDYLNTFLPPLDNEYEIPDTCRDRSSTNTAHNRPKPRKTPRTPGSVQSVVNMVPTTFSTPVSTRHFEDSLPPDEDYEVVSYVNYPLPTENTTEKDYNSLRSTEDSSTSDDDPEGLYHDVDEVEPETIVNDVIHNRPTNRYPPVPPKRGNSIKTQESPRNGHPNIKDIFQSELKDTLDQRTNSVKPKPSHRRKNIRQGDSEIEEARAGRKAECDDEEGAGEGLNVVRRTSAKTSGGPVLTTFKPEVLRRKGTEKSLENASNRKITIMEDNLPSPQLPPCSSDDEEDPNAPDETIPKEIYAHNARKAMKCEMEEPDGITCHAELGQLQNLGIVTTQYGACISDIPANLQRKFLHGDKIISINGQRIKDASFARSIIETSECKMIKYIAPGTMFAKQATGDMMAEKRCITHIERKFIAPGTTTKEVNVALRNAGHKFYIILQPVEFMKELMS
ncbi:hypothetical protein HOLleu_32916 [Holothuria leucospilota]|uniref:PDZ domain-containing protein n=1 Tax=Holothuria leucospilota TaxID=206669 RepID=A0A9Q0YMU3_HOLLE|nr:hypothetical protein HOLleu_32916 [Holothuria leucospilota]